MSVFGAHAFDRIRIHALFIRNGILLLIFGLSMHCVEFLMGLLFDHWVSTRLRSSHLSIHSILIRVGIIVIAFFIDIFFRVIIQELSLSSYLLHLPLAEKLGVLYQLIAKVGALVAKYEGVPMEALLAHDSAYLQMQLALIPETLHLLGQELFIFEVL